MSEDKDKPVIEIMLASDRLDPLIEIHEFTDPILTPGETVEYLEGYMTGHGTFPDGEEIIASVGGVVEKVNQLVSVRAMNSRYIGEIGEVVVGRIIGLQSQKWVVDTNSILESALHLTSVNLPGGEQRRRSVQDEEMMREFLKEGDLISAEIHQISTDGQLTLHTRSLRYGKLGQGILLTVPPSLIRRSKSHFCNLACGAQVILGCNGYVWVSAIDENQSGGFIQNMEIVKLSDRETITRLNNVIKALAESKVMLFDTSIQYAFEESMKYSAFDLLKPESKLDLVLCTAQKLQTLGLTD
uniref:Exosome complex component RRP4 n=1 Tax=Cacopsylla melanoneura TaxID=428564 RepID=A0A8D8WRD5_9HEMI